MGCLGIGFLAGLSRFSSSVSVLTGLSCFVSSSFGVLAGLSHFVSSVSFLAALSFPFLILSVSWLGCVQKTALPRHPRKKKGNKQLFIPIKGRLYFMAATN